VAVEREARVVDPLRFPRSGRDDHLAEAGRQMKAPRNPLAKEVDIQRPAFRHRTQGGHPSDMHVPARGLGAKEGGVQGRESLHVGMLPVRAAAVIGTLVGTSLVPTRHSVGSG